MARVTLSVPPLVARLLVARSGGPPPPPPRAEDRDEPDADRPSGWRYGIWLGLVALCLALYLPGLFSLPPIDRDESRFAQATRQMIETGDFVEIRFQDEARNKKPVGIHWAQAASAAVFGGSEAPIWAYRLPSVIGATAAVLLLFAGARRVTSDQTAAMAASVFAASIGLVLEAHMAKTDAALTAVTLAAQLALARCWMGTADRRVAWVFWVAQGLGILIKGPITPMISLLTVLALGLTSRRWRWLGALRPATGVPIALALVLPWMIAIWVATDGQFFRDAIGNDLAPKIAGGGQPVHSGPPGYHLLWVMAGLFPGSLLLVPALVMAWRLRHEPLVWFLIAWVVPSWIVFELAPNKLPHYVLPLYPALALLIARVAVDVPEALGRLSTRIGIGVWALVALVFAAAMVALPLHVDDTFDWVSAIGVGAAVAGVVMVVMRVRRGEAIGALTTAIGLGVLLVSLALQVVLPRVDGFWVSRSIEAMLSRNQVDRVAASGGFTEPSLVFLTQTDIRLGDGEQAAQALITDPSARVLVESRHIDRFTNRLLAAGLEARLIDQIQGFNYSQGRRVSVALFERLDRRLP
ncbi:MAG: glycosyltransferase family 39 protein [Alphaproteobacteria bacterium]|nr:glycosyltransferase family 39 protein [Alphaproteobacteria bacterium]TAD91459.1 MAG: glycosyltransferase family 39 protein [Alphaproteobacteria bacterium]